MIQAVIDIGTNSTLLLIGELGTDGHINSLHQEFTVTRLGENVHGCGLINEKAMQRTLDVLFRYEARSKRLGAEKVHVIGTQALRHAQNSLVFSGILERELGWQLRIISGEEEARYSFSGAMDAISLSGEHVVVMDVGGGSSEVIFGNKEKGIVAHESLPVGVVRLAEKMGMKPNLSRVNRNCIEKEAAKLFCGLSFIDGCLTAEKFIGVGGTVTTLAAVREQMSAYEPSVINGYELTLNDIESLYNRLNALSPEERRKLPGLVPGREDVILFGTLIFATFMNCCGFEKVIASDRGLRFGYLKEQLKQIEIQKEN